MKFTLNGKPVDVAAPPMKRLLDVLREECGLTGTKEGCGEGECGACTVLLDGEPVCACLVPFAQAREADVLTIEGLGGEHPLQRAFVIEGGTQCGMCTPGMILAAYALGPNPSIEKVRVGLSYEKMIEGIKRLAALKKKLNVKTPRIKVRMTLTPFKWYNY